MSGIFGRLYTNAKDDIKCISSACELKTGTLPFISFNVHVQRTLYPVLCRTAYECSKRAVILSGNVRDCSGKLMQEL